MNCCICSAPSSENIKVGKKEYGYCSKHKTDILIASDLLEEDPKAIEKLVNKYSKKK